VRDCGCCYENAMISSGIAMKNEIESRCCCESVDHVGVANATRSVNENENGSVENG
jgi:hypothetical protein